MELKWVEADSAVGDCPVPRDCHSCVKWDGGVVIYGGHCYEGAVQQLGDVWRFTDEKGWAAVGTGGVEREGHTAVVGNNQMIVFGGMSSAGEPYAMTARMNFTDGGWEEDVDEPPIPPRFYHTAAHHNGLMYVFGGCDNDAEFGDLWAYNIETREWTQPATTGTPPSPRYCHSSCVIDSGLIIFGGCQDATNYNDTFRLDLESFKWTELTPTPLTPVPRPRYGMALTTDPANGLIYVFGGQDDHDRYNDLFACNVCPESGTVSWALVPVSMPPENRAGHSLKLGDGGALYLYGGNSDGGKELPNTVLKLTLPVDILRKVVIWLGLKETEDSCSDDDEEDDESTDEKPWLEEDAMAGEVDFASLQARIRDMPPTKPTIINPNESVTTTCTSIGTSTDWLPDAMTTTVKSNTTGGDLSTVSRVASFPSEKEGKEGKKVPCAVQSTLSDLDASVKRKTIMLNNRIQENAELWKLETTTLKNRLTEVHVTCDDGLASITRRMDRLEETVDRAVGGLQDQMNALMLQIERLTHVVARGSGSQLGSPGLR